MTEGWWRFSDTHGELRELRSSGCPDTAELVGRICDLEGKVSQDAPDCLGPIEACEATVARIEEYGVEFGERVTKVSCEDFD